MSNAKIIFIKKTKTILFRKLVIDKHNMEDADLMIFEIN